MSTTISYDSDPAERFLRGAATQLPTLDILGTQHTSKTDPSPHQPGTNCSL